MSSTDAQRLKGLTPADDPSRSLPAWIYDNPEFLELEKERIFASSWHFICHENDLPNPGDYQALEIVGERVFVIRNRDGAVRGFYNVCRHRAARLLDGDRGHCKDRIVCPYHAWAYEVDGSLVRVPYEEEYENFERARHGLAPVETDTFLGFIFVRFQQDGPDLERYLSPVRTELELYRTAEMQCLCAADIREVPVNWKNGTDNYVDALHVRVAHPGLNSLLNKTYTLESPGGGVQRLHGYVENIVGSSKLARRYNEVLPDVEQLPESHRRLWLYYMVWPNFAFNIYPDQVELMQFLPVTAQLTRIRCTIYALPDPSPAMAEAQQVNIELNHEVGVEDQALITRVQHGMASRSFTSGPLGRNEICLRAFAERLRNELPVARQPVAPPAGQVASRNCELSQ